MRQWWRRFGRKAILGVIVASVLVGAALLAHVGTFSGQQSWQQATGWDQVPSELRSDAVVPGLSWLGHAGFVLETAGKRVLLDPNLSSHCTLSGRRWSAPVTPAELGPVDVVLISHAHRDHLDPETLAGLAGVGQVIVPAGAERWLPATLQAVAKPVRPGDTLTLGGVVVEVLGAAHNGHRHHPFGSEVPACSYLLKADGRSIYWAGDTGMGEHLAEVGERFQVDVAILPIGAFRPRWPLAKYHLSPAEAVLAAQLLGAGCVVPGHFGTFVLSLDGTDEALPRFAAAAASEGVVWAMPTIFTGVDLKTAAMVAATNNRRKEEQ